MILSCILAEFICKVATSTGIVLDPSYSGKAAFHLVKQLQENPERFKGRKILFIHTGMLDQPIQIRHERQIRSQPLAANRNLVSTYQDLPQSYKCYRIMFADKTCR